MMASSKPPYVGKLPGTSEWMDVWRMYPSWQEEMLSYQELVKIGINPVEPVEGFRVSNSALECASCSVKALLRYGYRVVVQEDLFPLLVGKAIHKGLAVYFKQGDGELAYRKFLDSYPEGAPPSDLARLEIDNVKTIMHHYFTEILKQFPYYVHPSLVEIWFEQALSYGNEETGECPIVLVGRIDLLPEDPQSKSLLVWDWKTTGKISGWRLKKWRMNTGLDGYQWAASRFMPSQLAPGCGVGAIELPKLPVPGRRCGTHGLDYSECRKFHAQHQTFLVNTEPHMIEEWHRLALGQARRLKDLIDKYAVSPEGVKYVRMTGKLNGMCTFCSYLDFCLAGRPVDWIGTVLQKREDLEGIEG